MEFKRRAWFLGAKFETEAWFTDAVFSGLAMFYRATFAEAAFFGGGRFAEETDFNLVRCNSSAYFARATFERTRELGPLLVLKRLSFEHSSFLEKLDLRVVANQLWVSDARFANGVTAWVRWAEVELEGADFGAPSGLIGVAKFDDLPEAELVEMIGDDIRSEQPRLVSARWANVGELTLAAVDLRACRFTGAHRLSGLRVEAESRFELTPAHRRVTRRTAIAEEHAWRSAHGTILTVPGWLPTACRFPRIMREPRPLRASEIATIYRELRKGREDEKDEPGAADFYYGEMEMRRLSAATPPAERVILTLYWVTAGYGLRASRALASLAVTIIIFAFGLYAWGFPSPESFLGSLTFSAESTTSLLRAPQRNLTIAGEWLQIGLRLLGPLFFGLALLSLRGRVKR